MRILFLLQVIYPLQAACVAAVLLLNLLMLRLFNAALQSSDTTLQVKGLFTFGISQQVSKSSFVILSFSILQKSHLMLRPSKNCQSKECNSATRATIHN